MRFWMQHAPCSNPKGFFVAKHRVYWKWNYLKYSCFQVLKCKLCRSVSPPITRAGVGWDTICTPNCVENRIEIRLKIRKYNSALENPCGFVSSANCAAAEKKVCVCWGSVAAKREQTAPPHQWPSLRRRIAKRDRTESGCQCLGTVAL